MKVGVIFHFRFEDLGEFLADVHAMETAGIDSVWMREQHDGYDPWFMLAAIAAVTSRLRLGLIPESPSPLAGEVQEKFPSPLAGEVQDKFPSPAGGGGQGGALTNDASRRFSSCRGTALWSRQANAGNPSTSLPIVTRGPPRSGELNATVRMEYSLPSTRGCLTSFDIRTT